MGRKSTRTSEFGVSKREGHDASAFYGRFQPPTLSTDDHVEPPKPVEEPFVCADASHMRALSDNSVALVVTSPPYFAGKEYELALDEDGIPASYLEYLDMLRGVFTECVRVLEPGGRIAVNVANLGRKPYRSLSADVIGILQDDLGLLLRGEIIWQKAAGSAGNCAWGSYRSAANPVMRDLTERVIVASKGRFDRALKPAERKARELPHQNTIGTDDFLELTLDVWHVPAESATRVGHPAPFPVELPAKLIQLYTYEDDLVLDPFMGAGTTLMAAAVAGRRFVGYDTDPEYVRLAEERVTDALASKALLSEVFASEVFASEVAAPASDDEARPNRSTAAPKLAAAALLAAGFSVTKENSKIRGTGLAVSFQATDGSGRTWVFDVVGTNTTFNTGMAATDVALAAIGKAAALRASLADETPIVLLTTALPKPGSPGERALRAVQPATVLAALDLTAETDLGRLHLLANGT